jgi:hypothetical protein
MVAEKNIRDELLKQNGAGAQKMRELRDKILARDEARVARMKKLTIITWAIIVLGMVAAFILRPILAGGGQSDSQAASFTYQYLSLVFISLVWCLITIAMVFTISLYVRSRSLTLRQVQARLAGIEEQLKRIAEKERTSQE